MCMWVIPVVPKQKTHGPLIDSTGSSLTFTIQVKGVLIKSTIIDETKGHVYLERRQSSICLKDLSQHEKFPVD